MSVIFKFNELANSRFLRNVLTISAGTVAGQLLLILATPILTRLYLPVDFGVFAVFNSLLSITVVASSFRYEIAIPLPKLDKHASYIVILSLVINLGISLISILIVYRWTDKIAFYTQTPLLKDYLWLLPLGIFFFGSYRIFNFWAVRNRDYKNISRTKIVQSVSSIIIQMTAGLLHFGAAGLIVGRLIGQSAGTLTLARGFKIHYVVGKKRVPCKIGVVAKIYKNFLKYDVAASVIDTLNVQLPQVILAIFFGPAAAGYYMLVDRVLAMPSSLIGQAVGQVFYGNWQKTVESGLIFEKTVKIIKYLIAIVIFPAIAIFIMGNSIFPLCFGLKWIEAGVFASWMIFGAVAQFVYSPISMALMATNGQKLNLVINIFLLAIKVAGGVLGFLLNSSLLTVQLFSFANAAVYGLGILLICKRVKSQIIFI